YRTSPREEHHTRRGNLRRRSSEAPQEVGRSSGQRQAEPQNQQIEPGRGTGARRAPSATPPTRRRRTPPSAPRAGRGIPPEPRTAPGPTAGRNRSAARGEQRPRPRQRPRTPPTGRPGPPPADGRAGAPARRRTRPAPGRTTDATAPRHAAPADA